MEFWYLPLSSILLGISTVIFGYFVPNVESVIHEKTRELNQEEYVLSLMISDHREYQRWDARAMMIRDHLLIMDGITEITHNPVTQVNLRKREREMLDAMVNALIAVSANMDIDLETSIPRWNKGNFDYLEKEKLRISISWRAQAQKRYLHKVELSNEVLNLEKRKNLIRFLALAIQVLGLITGFFITIHRVS